MDLKETSWGRGWINVARDIAQRRDVEHGNESSGSRNDIFRLGHKFRFQQVLIKKYWLIDNVNDICGGVEM
jgi:hypothetical protein